MGAYPCADGLEVVIGGNASSVFSRLMRVIGRSDLAKDVSLRTSEGRQAREDELNTMIEQWTRSRSLAEVQAELDAAGVPAGPVYDAASIAEDPHHRARGMIETREVVVDDEPRLIRFPGVVPVIPGAEGATRWLGPDLGAHTEEILRDVAGYTDTELSALQEATDAC